MHNKVSGGYYENVTPVPIPNTAVKLLSAENTWMVTSRENRSPPVLYKRYLLIAGIFFYALIIVKFNDVTHTLMIYGVF